MTFHVFYPGTYRGQYYLRYDSEATIKQIVRAILKDPVRPKMECPGVVLNRFKQIDTERGKTIKNRYEYLERTTGYYSLDVDGTGLKTELVKQELFNLPEIIVCWVSSSGNGVKAIGYNKSLVDLTPRDFTLQYKFLCSTIRYSCGIRINFDLAMSRCHQPIFLNSDPNALHR